MNEELFNFSEGSYQMSQFSNFHPVQKSLPRNAPRLSSLLNYPKLRRFRQLLGSGKKTPRSSAFAIAAINIIRHRLRRTCTPLTYLGKAPSSKRPFSLTPPRQPILGNNSARNFYFVSFHCPGVAYGQPARSVISVWYSALLPVLAFSLFVRVGNERRERGGEGRAIKMGKRNFAGTFLAVAFLGKQGALSRPSD